MFTEKRESLLLVALCIAATSAWLWFRVTTGIRLEDGLITFRFAENLANGNGFVYNVGERVLGTTTPLFTLLLAISGLLFGSHSVSTAADVISLSASLGAGLFTYFGLRKCGASAVLSLAVLCLFFFQPTTLWTTAGGMETALVVCLTAAGFYGVAAERFRLAAIASALLVLTRIDGIFWAGGIYLLILLRNRREFWKAVGLSVAIVLPWIVFATLYFGSPIPNTVTAKFEIGNEDIGYSLAGIISEAKWIANRFASSSPFGTLVGLIFFAVGFWYLLIKETSKLLKWAAIYTLVFAAAFYVGRAPRFPWYFVPVGWASIVVGVYGIGFIFEHVRRWVQVFERISWLRLTSSVLISGLFTVFLVRGNVQSAELHRLYQENEDGMRKPVGEWLRAHSDTNTSVAMEAVGYQGYYFGGRVIDLAGLVSPEVVRIRKESKSNADAFGRVLNELKPDYVVLRSFEYDENRHFHGGKLFESDQQKTKFDSAYEEVIRFTAPHADLWEDYGYLTIYGLKTRAY